ELVDGAVLELVLENVSAGHHFPSGASQDRRAWVELRAFNADQLVYSSGVVDDQTAVSSLADPDLWQLRDFAYGKNGQPAHMFWDIASLQSTTIPGPLTLDRSNQNFFKTHVMRLDHRSTSHP